MNQTVEQQRAHHALTKIRQLQVDPNLGRQEFVAAVESLPATILINGLGQACAMLLAKGNDKSKPQRQLYQALNDWLCRENRYSAYHGTADLMEAITSGDRSAYMYAQAEALAWLEWFKKFTVAFLKEKA